MICESAQEPASERAIRQQIIDWQMRIPRPSTGTELQLLDAERRHLAQHRIQRQAAVNGSKLQAESLSNLVAPEYLHHAESGLLGIAVLEQADEYE